MDNVYPIVLCPMNCIQHRLYFVFRMTFSRGASTINMTSFPPTPFGRNGAGWLCDLINSYQRVNHFKQNKDNSYSVIFSEICAEELYNTANKLRDSF